MSKFNSRLLLVIVFVVSCAVGLAAQIRFNDSRFATNPWATTSKYVLIRINLEGDLTPPPHGASRSLVEIFGSPEIAHREYPRLCAEIQTGNLRCVSTRSFYAWMAEAGTEAK